MDQWESAQKSMRKFNECYVEYILYYIIKWEIIILMLLIVCILRQDFDCILYKEIVGFE